MNRLRRGIFIAVGLLLVGMGVVGIVTPVLPTTVFFLAAGALFANTSPRLHTWLHRSRITGPFIRAYSRGEPISARRRIFTIVLLWLSIGVSAWLVRDRLWLPIILAVVLVGVTVHIATIGRSRKRSKGADGDARPFGNPD